MEPTQQQLTTIEIPEWDFKWVKTGVETEEEDRVLDQMLEGARNFIADMAQGRDPRWLVLIGLSGSGKTHIADRIRWFLRDIGRHIYNEFDRKRIDPKMQNPNSLYSYAQNGAFMCKWGALISKLRSQDYMAFDVAASDWAKIIDDLGVDSFDRDGNVTMFAVQKMAELLDRRLRKWTVITTNFTRAQIAAQFDPRIASRLMRFENVIIDASNVRDFNIRKELARCQA